MQCNQNLLCQIKNWNWIFWNIPVEIIKTKKHLDIRKKSVVHTLDLKTKKVAGDFSGCGKSFNMVKWVANQGRFPKMNIQIQGWTKIQCGGSVLI